MLNNESQVRLSVVLSENVTQSLLVSSEAISYFTSVESKPSKTSPSEWKKKSKLQRLESHLKTLAESFSPTAKFTYQIID